MNTYDFTRSRIFQWLGILLALGLIAVSYWYYRSQASTLNSPSTDPMSTGLTGYWALDEGTGTSATDSSTNGSTGTLTNSPTWTAGQIGGAVSFDGTNDYITITPTAAIKPQAQMTISAWVKRNASGETDYIFWERDSVVQEEGLFFYYGSDNKVHFVFRITGTGYTDVASTTTVTDTNWHLVTVTSGNSNATTFYIDGVNAGSGTTTTPNTGLTISSALLGARNGGGAPDFYGSITLDELRIYNRVLSPDEVAQLYRLSSPTGVDTNLKGYWSFNGDDISGTTAYDRSGSGNNGTLANGPVAIQGKIGQALDFDGTNDYVSTADYSYSNAQAFTMSVWFRADTVSGNQVIFSKETYEYNLRLTGSALAFSYWDTGANDEIGLYYSNVVANKWYLVNITYNGSGTAYMYVDGVRVSSDTNIVNAFQNKAEALRIGGGYHISGSPGYLNGKIDEMRIYNRALSEGEIQSLYTQGGGTKVDSAVSQPQGTGRLDSGLAGYWAMDDGSGTSATDSSTNANTGTLTGGPAWTTGQIGSAVDFDGTDDYVTVADADALDVADSTHFTLTGWFNRDTFTADHTIIAKRNGQAAGDTGYVLYVDDANDDVVFEVSDGTDEYSRTSTSSFTSSGWQHVAAVFDDTLGMTIYINGTVKQDAASGTLGNIGSLANTVAFRSGAESDAGSPFDGKLDEIRLYNRVLSPDEVNQLYRLNSPTSVDTGLKGYWSFNAPDMVSTTAYDRSGAGNTGTLTNGPAITEGRLGQALSFDGSNDYVSVAHDSALNAYPLTVSAWFKTSTTGGIRGIVNKFLSSSNNGWNIFFDNSDNLCAWYFKDASNYVYAGGGCTLNVTGLKDNQWHLVTFVVDSSGGTLYVDGVSRATRSWTGTAGAVSTSQEMRIGHYPSSSDYFNGKIDEVRIYNRALTAAEIKGLYDVGESDRVNSSVSQAQGTGRLDSDLVAYWPFDDGTGSTAVDVSTNSFDGSASGGPTWTTGQIGGAAYFDGSARFTNSSSTAVALNPIDGESFTLAGWFNRDTFTGDDTLLAKRAGQSVANEGYIVYIDGTTDKVTFEVSDDVDEYQLESVSTFTATGWHHVVVSWNDVSGAALYINGVAEAATVTGTFTNINDLTSATGLALGADSIAANLFNGSLDEIRIYGRALSGDEVAQLYRLNAPTGTDTGLKGYWSFNGQDVSGTTAYDRSGAGNTGTLTNGPTATEGRLGQGLSFDGGDDYVNVPDSTTLSPSAAMTVSFWTNITSSISSQCRSFLAKNASGQRSWALTATTSGGVVFYVATNTNDTGTYGSTGGSLIVQNQWAHVTAVFDGAGSGNADRAKIYVNGVQSNVTFTGTIPASLTDTSQAVRFGESAMSCTALPGYLDEVRIYNRALTEAEIKSLYNASR